jgi:DNA invertase Pin-like site-specific DNA recombinase
MTTADFIQPHHLQRQAVVSIRQSSANQVLNNPESLDLPYALRERACQCGWNLADVHVIAADLGRTGSNASARPDFQELVTPASLGQVGIIFSDDVTRRARNGSDWYQLLDLCGGSRCLIGDSDGIYDPAAINGRLLLGLKGPISELELHTSRARLGQAHEQQRPRLRYQARLAERQYDKADPDNRLVTAERAKRWEVALQDRKNAEQG